MPSTSAPDHAKKEALQYLNGFGEIFLTSCMLTMPFYASYTGGLSQPYFFCALHQSAFSPTNFLAANEFQSEALAGALPVGQNNPQVLL